MSDGQRIGLRVRSFLDLRGWFHNNEVPTCEVCNEAAVKAKRVCPGCGTQLRPVAKKETVEEEEDNQGGPQEKPLPPDPSVRKRSRISCHRRADRNPEDSNPTASATSLPSTRRLTLTRSSARQGAI